MNEAEYLSSLKSEILTREENITILHAMKIFLSRMKKEETSQLVLLLEIGEQNARVGITLLSINEV